MRNPIRVLVVEDRKSERFIAQQLLADFDQDFSWQQVADESEIGPITEIFNPNVVFCADEMPLNSRPAGLEMLRLLAPQTAVIQVIEVNNMNGKTLRERAEIESQCGDPPWSGTANLSPLSLSESAGSRATPTQWRTTPPSILERSADVIAMSDSSGWITFANTHASGLLLGRTEQSIGTVLGLDYDFASPVRGSVRLAIFDAATGLPNPIHLSDLLGCMMSSARGELPPLSISALDLQGLRYMNESCGPAMSDEVLKVIASKLNSGSTRRGMVARVGNDDLLVVLPDPARDADTRAKLENTRPAVREAPYNAPAFHSDDAATTAKRRLPFEAGLDEALQRHAIGVHFQPQFELQSGRGCGVEALARWILASGESVAPSIFIPVAEQAGMIDALCASVVQSACATAAAWRGKEAEKLTVSVNVSAVQINLEFFHVLARILETSAWPAQRLELEIPESTLLANPELTLRCVKQWKRLGLRIAVNHAGTNYSDLGYLSQMPIDRLKLDRALVHEMTVNEKTEGFVHALIATGAKLGIDVIAEGVETETQFQMLMELGCLQAQGYLLGRPMPAVQAQVVLRKPWGSLPKSLLTSIPVIQDRYAS